MNHFTSATRPKVGVIGGGLAGLTAAVQLAHAGVQVTLFEKNERVGGKMNLFEKDGFLWDTGPSLLTMPYVLREFFVSVGRDLDQYLTLLPVEPCCRYWWADGATLDEDQQFWQRPEVARFLAYAQGLYEISADLFLNPFAGWKEWLAPSNLLKLKHLPKIATFKTMHELVRQHFEDPHLVQLFDRYATYNGSSPYRTPAAFNIIPYVEAKFGGWYVQGGMYQLAAAPAKLAEEFGVDVRTGAEVTGLVQRGCGYTLTANAQDSQFDGVICNQDVLMAYQQLLPPKARFSPDALRKTDLSTSGFILFLGVAKKYEKLAHHNVFFSEDYELEFREMFELRRPASAPTIYVAASSRTEPERAPQGCDNWFVLVNAPAHDGSLDWAREAPGYGDRIIRKLESFGFPDLSGQIRVRECFTPADFQSRYNALGGSLYGLASNGVTSAFKRPAMRPDNLDKFSFAGGSTHPGGGIPLVVISGRRAAMNLLSSFHA